MLTRVVFNQKGGVGKSSITVNLAAISAAQGLRTLVIDLDPQANSSQYLLGEEKAALGEKAGFSPNIEEFFADTLGSHQQKGLLGQAIGSILKNHSRGLEDFIHSTPFAQLDVLPASPTLGALEHMLESKHKIYKLRDAVRQLAGRYERIYIDTPPAFNFFTLSALITADRVLIPFDCDVFSKRALNRLIENIIETQDDHNDALIIEGIVVNQYQAQARLPREVVQELKDEQLPVLNSMLPPSVLMKESHHKNLPLLHLASEHKLTQAYVSLFNEIEQA